MHHVLSLQKNSFFYIIVRTENTKNYNQHTCMHVIVVVVVLYQKQHPPPTPPPNGNWSHLKAYDANSYQHPFQPDGCITTTFFLNFKILSEKRRPSSQHSSSLQLSINLSSTQNLNPQIAPKSIHITLSLSLYLLHQLCWS